jgi:hypothetical protein
VDVLVGSTGLVGGHLLNGHKFDRTFHRSNVEELRGLSTNLLVCAGLPAEKWKANAHPNEDLENVNNLAKVLSQVEAQCAILISTVDVFRNPVGVDELSDLDLNNPSGYGRNRALFENFFSEKFQNTLIVRLPGLIADDLKKNLIFDLLNKRDEQLSFISSESKFQFFDLKFIWEVIQFGLKENLRTLNVATEPVSAREVAQIFNVELEPLPNKIFYDMRSAHSNEFGGSNGYLYNRASVLNSISILEKKTT